jgi:hypothetical protein
MGHSGKVAEKHYLQVTEEHWSRTIEPNESRPLTCPFVSSHSEAITKNQDTKKPSYLLGCDGERGLLIPYLVTPTGVEPVLPP